MKKPAIILCAIILAGFAAVDTFPQGGDVGGSLPAEEGKSSLCAALEPSETYVYDTPLANWQHETELATAIEASESTTEVQRDSTPLEGDTLQRRDGAHEAERSVTTEPTATAAPSRQDIASAASDPYRTDVYPNNVYSEEYLYDVEGNLIGKTTTIPTAFGPDAIWIDGRAYYDVPGFGLIEWSGPGSVTEDYTMYENGNKVGIMGDEDETPAHISTPVQPDDQQEPTGEVIDQSINGVPEKSGTPPDYKPDTTPPDDPNARIMD